MDSNRNRPNHLGINKISKNIHKSTLHQPTAANPQQQQQQNNRDAGGSLPQPQVYNISKSDFRSVVQRLTGTPTRDPFPSSDPPPPARPPPKPTSVRLQKIRPPPLAPLARPPIPLPHAQRPPHPVNPHPNPNFYERPVPTGPAAAAASAQLPAFPFSPLLPPTPPPGSAALWGNTLESPISAYMRYLESSILNPDGSRPPQQPHQSALQLPPPGQMQQMLHPHQGAPHPNPLLQEGLVQVTGSAPSSTGVLPNPHAAAAFPSPRDAGPPPLPASGLLPSPTSPFILPSPSAFLNLMSPLSPFPLLSPRFQYPPLTPNHAFSPMGGQSGILGPGPQPPPSPGLMFPASPSGFLSLTSPRWRNP